jgi:hypothetical protein
MRLDTVELAAAAAIANNFPNNSDGGCGRIGV